MSEGPYDALFSTIIWANTVMIAVYFMIGGALIASTTQGDPTYFASGWIFAPSLSESLCYRPSRLPSSRKRPAPVRPHVVGSARNTRVDVVSLARAPPPASRALSEPQAASTAALRPPGVLLSVRGGTLGHLQGAGECRW